MLSKKGEEIQWIGQVEIKIKTDTSEEVIQIEELEPAPAKLDDSLAPVQRWRRSIWEIKKGIDLFTLAASLITGEFRERLRNLLRE